MNSHLYRLMREAGYAHPQSAVRAQKLAALVVQSCISQAALVGLSNYEGLDVLWASTTICESIKNLFETDQQI